ncbi:MAG: S8 family peptidase, partial [Gammaproteobacteria bacterium]
MQRSISIPASIPLTSIRRASRPRVASGVRRKVARIAWTAALIAICLGPTSVMAEDGPVTTIPALRSATNGLGIGAGTEVRADSKAGPDLAALYGEYQTYLEQAQGQGRGASGFRSANVLARIAAGHVVVDLVASGDPEALAADLEALGMQDAAVFGRIVSGRLPLGAVPALENLGSLQFARPAYAMTLVGNVTSQGDVAMRADIARSTFGIDGTGVTVGALSDSFNCLGGAAAGVASGDLPAAVAVLEEGPCAQGLTDEARALAEVIHDVAPGAAIAVHSAFNGQANFAQGIVDLANAGARVITDDVIYFAEPMFQDGPIAQAVDQVKTRGISYFSAAGNQARTSYEFPFNPSGQTFDIGRGPAEAHDFDPGEGIDTCQQITLPGGGRVSVVSFQWDQPFASATLGGPGSQSDLDIVLTDAVCNDLPLPGPNPFPGATNNVGRDPVEFFGVINNGPTAAFGLRILRRSGPPPGLMKTVLFGSSLLTINEFDTRSGTSFGHGVARGGLGVGAADYRHTPVFGQSPPLIETFSSAGGTPILFDTAGNRLATPELRAQPAITAPDGANTTFFFRGVDPEEDGFPNFFGTSASAPHAAGVAALITDRNPSFGPDNIYSVLKSTAIDMDDPATAGFDTGFDFGTGFGLIQADAALAAVPTPPPPPAIPPIGFPPVSTCQARTCGVRLTCQDPSTSCTSQVNL